MGNFYITFEKQKKAEQILQQIRAQDNQVILFGAGRMGKLVLKACHKQRIKVKCFCDNFQPPASLSRDISSCFSKQEDIPLLAPSVITSEDIVVICSDSYYTVIEDQMKQIGCVIVDFIDLFISTDWTYDDFLQYTMEFINIREKIQKNAAIENNTTNKPVLDCASLMITERCTLKCKGCVACIDHYVKQDDSDFDLDLRSLDNLFHAAAFIKKIILVGGETFLNMRLHEYISIVMKYNNFGFLHIPTNATNIPDDRTLQKLHQHRNRLSISISDYHLPQQKIEELIALLQERQIPFHHRKFELSWFDFGNFEKQDISSEELQNLYQRCTMPKDCITIHDGKLYVCAFLASAHKLQAIPQEEVEYVDLIGGDVLQLAEKLNNFLARPYMKGCQYCLGGGRNEHNSIAPAVQVQKPLPYHKYEYE